MPKLGIFAKTFPRPIFSETLDETLSHGIKLIHFNFSCVGLPSMPSEIPKEVLDAIHKETHSRGIKIAGVSGTFNITHPDKSKIKAGMEQLKVIAKACKFLPTKLISLCSGTKDPQDMWKEHPDNSTPAAWNEMIQSMKEMVKIAEEYNVYLGIEPEVANIVDSVQKARRLLYEMGSKHLKIILDPANLFRPKDVPDMTEIIDEAFRLLKNDIAMGHAKDFRVENNAIVHVAPGKGLLDYDLYLDHLQDMDVPLIMHGLKDDEVAASMQFIASKTKTRK